MRKNGIIPPHFLYYIENEGIDITEFKSSNFTEKDPYDRMVVNFPYGVSRLPIQVIFDKLDYSSPPDFILIKDSIVMNYRDIIQEWNFRESSSLYTALSKIRLQFSAEQERRLREKTENINAFSYNENNMSWVGKILQFIKSKFASYKEILKSDCVVDIVLGDSDLKTDEKYKNHVILSYPIDISLRSRNITRFPIFNILIPLSYEGHFYISITTPHFINISDFKIQEDLIKLINFSDYINKYELYLIDYFKEMKLREVVINKITEANIGFPLEIDTSNFNKLSLYFSYNKNSMSAIGNSSMKMRAGQSTPPITSNTPTNFILHFHFLKDEFHKIEFHIIDADKLQIVIKKQLGYSSSDREMNNLVHSILQTVLDNIQLKKK
jgi:hypothetical protein